MCTVILICLQFLIKIIHAYSFKNEIILQGLLLKTTLPISCSSGTSLVAQMVKNRPAMPGDPGSIPGLGRSPGEINGNPLQYSCLKNLMVRGSGQMTVHGVARVGQELVTNHLPLHLHI